MADERKQGAWRGPFLKALRRTGNVRAAARAAGVQDTTAYAAKKRSARFAEQWRDQAAIDAHMASPHMGELMAALGTARIEAMKIDAYEAHFLKTILGG